MKQNHASPLVIIDIAVPRNVAPAVGQIDNVFLYNIDDLIQIEGQNRTKRGGETEKAGEIVFAELAMFDDWWRASVARPVVTALMKKAEDIRRAQLDKTLKKLDSLSDEERDNLAAMTKSIIAKILKDPVEYLKANMHSDSNCAEIVSELFRLDIRK
jgi:glutamyl-tRNA reductase